LVLATWVLAACTDESRPPEPTPTPTATVAQATPTANTIDLGIKDIGSLGKYRYTLDVTATGIAADAHLTGEYFTPNLGIISGTVGGANVEQLIAGQRIYVRDSEGEWVRISAVERTPIPGSENQVISADNLIANPHPLLGFRALLQNSTELVERGEETINGVSVRKIDYRIDPDRFYGENAPEIKARLGGPIPDFGGGSVWLEPENKRIHKFTVTIDLARFTEISAISSALQYPTPTPGGPSPTPVPPSALTITMTIRDHNDPGIAVVEPTPRPQPVATATSTPAP
jgi:hypothetical protein